MEKTCAMSDASAAGPTILDQFRLDKKVAWITGGTKGLGMVLADALASVGADVFITSRNADEAAATAATLARKYGHRALGLAADVTSPAAVDAAVARAQAELGGIDVLLNNAGTTVRKSTVDMPIDDWKMVVDINLNGPFYCSKAVIPAMVAKGWGRIIYISSIFGLVGMPGRTGYVATKGAIVQLAKAQALELATTGVTVNSVCPGPFATALNRGIMEDPEKYKQFVARIPMGRWGEMHELPGAIVYLASNAASYVTGTSLVVDGGWTAQ